MFNVGRHLNVFIRTWSQGLCYVCSAKVHGIGTTFVFLCIQKENMLPLCLAGYSLTTGTTNHCLFRFFCRKILEFHNHLNEANVCCNCCVGRLWSRTRAVDLCRSKVRIPHRLFSCAEVSLGKTLNSTKLILQCVIVFVCGWIGPQICLKFF